MSSVEKEKRRGIKVIISIFTIVLCACIAYTAFDIFYTKSKPVEVKKPDKEEDKQEEKEIEEISIDSDIVKNAMNDFSTIYIKEEKFYASDKFSVDALDKFEIISTAISSVGDKTVSACQTDKTRENVSIDELNSGLKKYLLNQTITMNDIKSNANISSYTDADYDYGTTRLSGTMTNSVVPSAMSMVGVKVIDDNNIQLYSSCGATFHAEDYINKKIIKAEKTSKELYVYEKQAFAKYDETTLNSFNSSEYKVNYYKTYQKTGEIVENILSSEITNEDFSVRPESIPNWELYNTYKYTFKLVDGNYYFKKIEVVK